MLGSLTRVARRLVNPRSRRSQLWACVYSGAFDVEAFRADGGTMAEEAERAD